eukprot:scaffold177158_cov27-Tisochrysis_lutea.AAC.1
MISRAGQWTEEGEYALLAGRERVRGAVWLYRALLCAAVLLCLLPTSPGFRAAGLLLLEAKGSRCGSGAPILLTGYEPWGGMVFSPAKDIALSLDGQCVGRHRIEAWTLPVAEPGARQPAEALAKSGEHAQWAAVIHLGFEHVAKGLKVELAASNVLATHPHLLELGSGGAEAVGELDDDKAGRCSARPDSEIAIDAPCLLATTAPLEVLSLPLEHGKYAAQEIWSRDPGTFYCNEVYFRTLHAVRARELRPHPRNSGPPGALLPVVFVHVPPEVDATERAGERFVLDVAHKMTYQAR